MNSEWVTMQWLSGGLQVVWPPNNRMWVTHQWFCAKQSHQISSHNQQDVSDTWSDFLLPDFILWLKGSEWECKKLLSGTSMPSHPITNRKWVTLLWLSDVHSHHISSCGQQFVSPYSGLCQVVSSHLFLWPTACEWQGGTEMTFFWAVALHCFLWLTGSKQHCSDFLPSNLIIFHSMTNRWWVMLQSLSVWQSHHTCMTNRK